MRIFLGHQMVLLEKWSNSHVKAPAGKQQENCLKRALANSASAPSGSRLLIVVDLRAEERRGTTLITGLNFRESTGLPLMLLISFKKFPAASGRFPKPIFFMRPLKSYLKDKKVVEETSVYLLWPEGHKRLSLSSEFDLFFQNIFTLVFRSSQTGFKGKGALLVT